MSLTGSFQEENVENLPPSTLLCTSNISAQKEIDSSKEKRKDYLQKRGRRKKWWYFNRSLQPISEACENKDDPSIIESNNAITNDNETLSDEYLNIKNQSLNNEKSDNFVGSNDQPFFKDSYSPCLKVIEKFQEIVMDSAVRVIQAAFKRFRERRRFLRIKKAVMVIQRNLRKWIQARQCLRPAEFERQSSDGEKSDEYRESEEYSKERNLEIDSDDSPDLEESPVENVNGKTEANANVNSDTNSLESIHSQNNHNIDDTTQDINALTENTNESSGISISYLTLDDANNQDSTKLHSNTNTIHHDPNPVFLDSEQKELEKNTINIQEVGTITDSYVFCESTKEAIEAGTITGSHDACGRSSHLQLSNEGVSSDNAATIVSEPTTDHQQEDSELTSHIGKTHERQNQNDEQVLESGKQCKHVPCEQSEMDMQDTQVVTTMTDNEVEKEDNDVENIANKIQFSNNVYKEEMREYVDSNIDIECLQETNTNSNIEQNGETIDNTQEVQENSNDEQCDGNGQEVGKENEHTENYEEAESYNVLESLQTNEDKSSNYYLTESIGAIMQDNSGDEKSSKLSSDNLNEHSNTDNDINLCSIKA